LRRLAFHGYSPSALKGMQMKITPFDTSDVAAMKADESYQEYVDNEENYGVIDMKEKLNPMNSWAIPFVTGHQYRIHWGEG
jgi:hypothetical protein